MGGVSWTFSFSLLECWLARYHAGIVLANTAARSSRVQIPHYVMKTLNENNLHWHFAFRTFPLLLLKCSLRLGAESVWYRFYMESWSFFNFSLHLVPLWNSVVYHALIAGTLHSCPLKRTNWTQYEVVFFFKGKKEDITLGGGRESRSIWRSTWGCVWSKYIAFIHGIVKEPMKIKIMRKWWVVSVGKMLVAKACPELYSQYQKAGWHVPGILVKGGDVDTG